MESAQKMGISEHLTALLKNLYPGRNITVWIENTETDWFQVGKRMRQGCMPIYEAGLEEDDHGFETVHMCVCIKI